MAWQSEGTWPSIHFYRLRDRQLRKLSCCTRVEEKSCKVDSHPIFGVSPTLCMQMRRFLCPVGLPYICKSSVLEPLSTSKLRIETAGYTSECASINHRWRMIRRQDPLLIDGKDQFVSKWSWSTAVPGPSAMAYRSSAREVSQAVFQTLRWDAKSQKLHAIAVLVLPHSHRKSRTAERDAKTRGR
jgi:hypothetical protein